MNLLLLVYNNSLWWFTTWIIFNICLFYNFKIFSWLLGGICNILQFIAFIVNYALQFLLFTLIFYIVIVYNEVIKVIFMCFNIQTIAFLVRGTNFENKMIADCLHCSDVKNAIRPWSVTRDLFYKCTVTVHHAYIGWLLWFGIFLLFFQVKLLKLM